MDLSSLEGPQMVNPKYIIPPDPTIRSHRSTTPTHVLFSKPLPRMPPRPRSADPSSPPSRRQNRRDYSSPSGSANDNPLRRTPACKNRRRQSDEMCPGRNPQDHQREFEFWTRPAYAAHIAPQQQQQQRPRPQSCMPTNLIWLEDEKQWTIGKPKKLPLYQRRERLPSRASTSTRSALSPLPPLSPISSSAVSPLSNDQPVRFYMESNDLNGFPDDELPSPLSSRGHGFGPDHTQSGHDRVSRWISVVERRQGYGRGSTYAQPR